VSRTPTHPGQGWPRHYRNPAAIGARVRAWERGYELGADRRAWERVRIAEMDYEHSPVLLADFVKGYRHGLAIAARLEQQSLAMAAGAGGS
jgi:hypothetical protein